MILVKLPKAVSDLDTDTPPVFSDHHLFTEEIDNVYEYPEHASGFGIISTFEGNGNFYLNKEKFKIDNNTFLPVNRGSRLSIRLSERNTHPALLFFHSKLAALVKQSLAFSAEALLDKETDDMDDDFSCLERTHFKDPLLRANLKLMLNIGGSCSSFSALKADIVARNILEQLILENHTALKLSYRIAVVKRSTRIELYKRLELAREWIEQNYSSAISLEDMAAQANLNSQHFLRIFKQCYNITPHQFLINSRLENAKLMLASGDDSVSSVCNTIGFESLSSFSWLFKKKFGISPSQYRLFR